MRKFFILSFFFLSLNVFSAVGDGETAVIYYRDAYTSTVTVGGGAAYVHNSSEQGWQFQFLSRSDPAVYLHVYDQYGNHLYFHDLVSTTLDLTYGVYVQALYDDDYLPPPVLFEITSPLTSNGTVDVFWSYTITGAGGIEPYDFGFTGGLPAWMNFDDVKGVFSGIPPLGSDGSVYNINLVGSDSSDPYQTDQKTLVLTIGVVVDDYDDDDNPGPDDIDNDDDVPTLITIREAIYAFKSENNYNLVSIKGTLSDFKNRNDEQLELLEGTMSDFKDRNDEQLETIHMDLMDIIDILNEMKESPDGDDILDHGDLSFYIDAPDSSELPSYLELSKPDFIVSYFSDPGTQVVSITLPLSSISSRFDNIDVDFSSGILNTIRISFRLILLGMMTFFFILWFCQIFRTLEF